MTQVQAERRMEEFMKAPPTDPRAILHMQYDKWWSGNKGVEKAGHIMDMLYQVAVTERSVKHASLFLAYALGLPKQSIDVKNITVNVTADELRAAVQTIKQIEEVMLEGTQVIGNANPDTSFCMDAPGGVRPDSEE